MDCAPKKAANFKQLPDDNEAEFSWKIWPIVRNNYQRIAYEAYKSNDIDKAILYDCKALSCGFIGRLCNVDYSGRNIDHQTITKSIHLQQNTGNNFADYMAARLNDISINETNDHMNDQNQFKELCEKCVQLPKQWNVVQISQIYDGYNSYARKEDLYTSDASIKITLLRNSLPEKQNSNRSVSIVLDWFEFGKKSILSTSHEVVHVLYKNYSNYMNTKNYATFLKNLTQMQSKLVSDLSFWLGPWATLLCGKVKGKVGEEFERKIFEQVDKFCNELDNFTDEQRMQLSLLARRIDLLNSDKIKNGSRDIASNHTQSNRIMKFLANLKSKHSTTSFEYYPCILVIDEILDSLPWEMVITIQEFTRVHSIYLLFDLYDRYKDQIDDGYLKVNVKEGFALINPDNDEKLGDMSKRMTKYYENHLPNWKCLNHVIPTLEQMSDGLQSSDVFVYSGHGSSLQHFPNFEFEHLKHKSIMLLFGCESIAMKAQGIICEADCPAFTYFKQGCPGVLGAITIVTDIWVDLISIYLLTQWTTSEEMKHPKIDVCRDEHTKERVGKILKKCEGKRNPNLLQLLCDIRNEDEINIRMKSAMIFRGLPPYNTSLSAAK